MKGIFRMQSRSENRKKKQEKQRIILGAIILIWADVLSRALIKGTEIPIGIVISIIGSPLFVWLMIKKNYGFGGSK